MEKKIAIIVALASLLMAYLVTADTACSSQDCYVNISLTVGNAVPVITWVQDSISVTGTAETSATVNVRFNASDLDGYTDLNDATAQCVGYKSGEASRTSTSCSIENQSGDLTAYNCSVTFQYYDAGALDWKWNCSVADGSGIRAYDDAVTFSVNDLNYVDVDVTSFTWTAINANVDDIEANSAINLDNGGNQDYETATVTAYSVTDGGSNIIPATAFYLNNATGDAAGTQMVNGTEVAITSWFTLQHGSGANEDIFAYVDMPNVPSGSYSSTDNWLIDITA